MHDVGRCFPVRERLFLRGLINGCEGFVAITVLLYSFGIEAMGNPNFLGGVMALWAPILMWGLLAARSSAQHRKLLLFAICMHLLSISHSRAAVVAAVLVSCVLLCLAQRRDRLLHQGAIMLAILISTNPLLRPHAMSSWFSTFASCHASTFRPTGNKQSFVGFT